MKKGGKNFQKKKEGYNEIHGGRKVQEKSNSFVSINKQINNYMDVPHVEHYKFFVIGIIKIYTKCF